MMTRLPDPPGTEEFAPFYSGYVQAVGERDPLAVLDAQPGQLDRLLSGVREEEDLAPYAPGKWSVREVLVHVSDSERIFAARALRIARGDSTPLPGFEQDDYASASAADRRTLEDVVSELHAVRASTMALFRSFRQEDYLRTGTASGSTVSVRALLWITAGHMESHLTTLRTRYGLG
jgi:uncharacterized damage-inducible protein DinB